MQTKTALIAVFLSQGGENVPNCSFTALCPSRCNRILGFVPLNTSLISLRQLVKGKKKKKKKKIQLLLTPLEKTINIYQISKVSMHQ